MDFESIKPILIGICKNQNIQNITFEALEFMYEYFNSCMKWFMFVDYLELLEKVKNYSILANRSKANLLDVKQVFKIEGISIKTLLEQDNHYVFQVESNLSFKFRNFCKPE